MALLTQPFAAAAFLAANAVDAQGNPAAGNAAHAPEPAAEAPSADALLALDKQANEAYSKGDSQFFASLLSEKFVMRGGGQRVDRAAVLRMIAGVECDVTTWTLDEHWMGRIDADTYVSSYRGTLDGSCAGPHSESVRIPSPARAATIWVRSGEDWQAVFHGENAIIDPRNAPGYGEEIPAVHGNSVHVRDGDAWKLAFTMNMPAM
jgi:hypothetical protein